MSEPTMEEILRRSMEGPIFPKDDWNKKLIPKKVNEKLEEYGLKGVCDPENPIPTDDGLADKFWAAGCGPRRRCWYTMCRYGEGDQFVPRGDFFPPSGPSEGDSYGIRFR